MAGGQPAISGVRLAKLLESDGWTKGRECPHGTAYSKMYSDGIRITTIPRRRKSLAPTTLADILGHKQTCLGRRGLLRLLAKKKKEKR